MNQSAVDRVLQSPRLPSLPTIALEVIQLVQKHDVDIKQIAGTIQYDPALSTKLLRTVNSSFYGQSKPISTVSHAIVVLGLNAVKTLALGFSLVGNLDTAGGAGFDHMKFWRRSLFSASGAKTLAQTVGVVQHEEAFLAGLLQDLGMLAMAQTLGEQYHKVIGETGGHHAKLRDIEREHLEVDHAEVGALLAESWRLPPVLVDPIRFHTHPEDAEPEIQPMVRAIAAGNLVAEVFMSEPPDQAVALDHFYSRMQQWFDIDRDEAEPLLAMIHKQTQEMKQLLELPTGELGNADQILGQANEALLQLTLESQQTTTQLQEQNQRLKDEAYTDSLTGVPNRRQFNETITEHFNRAKLEDRPLSVLFLDTDNFKQFNDTYGHQTGDRVLIALGDRLQDLIGEGGVACRYGGEEFAVVLPNVPRREAGTIAEYARQSIEQIVVESDEGQTLSITASIGVATYEGTTFERVEQLVKAADQGVYAAKSSGRNCVRIFVPRKRQPAVA